MTTRAIDDDAWDAFVDSSSDGTLYQLSGWAQVKAAGGWRGHRLRLEASGGPVGAQLLVVRRRPLPWAFAYLPRGPFGVGLEAATVPALTTELRRTLRAERVAVLRADPEIEAGGPRDPDGAFAAALRAAGWRPAPAVQRTDTWLLDLAADETALWDGLNRSSRRDVERARRNGVVVRDVGRERLPDFYRLLAGTAERRHFIVRSKATFELTWDAFAADGRVGLRLAETADGLPVAGYFLIRCGRRVSVPWAAVSPAARELRATHLLKWETIVRARREGATEYDMGGVVNPGIGHFKAAFGGRSVRYIGAWDLVLDPVGAAAWTAARRAAVTWSRLRHGRPASPATDPDAA
jgi:lipid II:glycine glycyltransferase (peptidoglycan interpeptide bridge formation enzyme)